jgi:hypothetical protein
MIDFDHLKALHEAKRLRLVTTVRMQGVVTLNDDPDLMVRELIRLAAIGQRTEYVEPPKALGVTTSWSAVQG